MRWWDGVATRQRRGTTSCFASLTPVSCSLGTTLHRTAQAINEKPQVIQEYEQGKAIPNPQVLSKLSRVLGVVLKK
jgi:hypothetical protein